MQLDESRAARDRDDIAGDAPERATPDQMSGLLMESEHRCRYLWAASLARRRRVIDAGCGAGYGSEILAAAGAEQVVGVDISSEAIEEARTTVVDEVCEFRLGDLRDLPFESESFDLAVCFEAIEHVQDQTSSLAELRRVLARDGVLLISSPNRDVYPPGNPHHTHEFVPAELEAALGSHFGNVRLYRQSPWLASAIFDDSESRSTGPEHALRAEIVKMSRVKGGEEMYTVALASDAELPSQRAMVTLGKAFELRWWHEQLAATRQRVSDAEQRESAAMTQFHDAAREAAALRESTAIAREHERVSAQRVLEVEGLLADALARAAALTDAYEAHTRQIAELTERVERADRVHAAMRSSLSWRVTAPIRALKRLR